MKTAVNINLITVERLKNRGVAVKKINFPNRSTIIGDVINRFLKNTQELSHEVIHLLFSANRWECMSSIQADLLAGTTIICDRYAYSGVVYSVAKGLGMDWCWAPDLGLLKPDAVFYLKANPDHLASRGSFGNERFVYKYQFDLIICKLIYNCPVSLQL